MSCKVTGTGVRTAKADRTVGADKGAVNCNKRICITRMESCILSYTRYNKGTKQWSVSFFSRITAAEFHSVLYVVSPWRIVLAFQPQFLKYSNKSTLGNSLAPIFVADFPPYAHKFIQRTRRVRLVNLCTSDEKSSHKSEHKEFPRVLKKNMRGGF